MCEPRCSLVNVDEGGDPVAYWGSQQFLLQAKAAGTSSGVSGATRSEGAIAEHERPTGPKRPGYKHRRRNDRLVSRESDKAIVVRIPGTNNLGGAKGLDLDSASEWKEGQRIGDEPRNLR